MKAKTKISITLLLLTFQYVSFQASAITTTPIDSMFSVIRGSWYQNFECNSFAGKCDSVYSDVRYIIGRMYPTDTVVWQEYKNDTLKSTTKYVLSKKMSSTTQQLEWMLTLHSGELLIDNIIKKDKDTLRISLDAVDAPIQIYGKLINERPASQARIDSLAQCLAGDWYRVIDCMGFTGVCDSIYSTGAFTITPKLGTDTILFGNWYYRIIETANNMRHRKSWMVESIPQITTDPVLIDSFLVPGVFFRLRQYISCGDNMLGISLDAYDCGSSAYSRTPRLATPEKLAIDSLAMCMSDYWYKVQECGNLSATCDTVYSNVKNKFTHHTGDNIITWYRSTSNYQNLDTVQYQVAFNPDSAATGYRFVMNRIRKDLPQVLDNESYFMKCKGDSIVMNRILKGGITTMYARTYQEKPYNQLEIDSVADCLKGTWYLRYICNNQVICDSVKTTVEFEWTHKAGTDSIFCVDKLNPQALIYNSFHLVQTDDNLTGEMQWMLKGREESICPPGMDCLKVIYFVNKSFSCDGSKLVIQGGVNNPYVEYSRIDPNNGINGVENPVKDFVFSVSPNPVKTDLQIIGEATIDGIKLINLQGSTLFEERGEIRKISISGYSSGLYFLQIESEGKVQTIKIIKQ